MTLNAAAAVDANNIFIAAAAVRAASWTPASRRWRRLRHLQRARVAAGQADSKRKACSVFLRLSCCYQEGNRRRCEGMGLARFASLNCRVIYLSTQR